MADEIKSDKVTLEETCGEYAGDDRRAGKVADREGRHYRGRVQDPVERGAGELSRCVEAVAVGLLLSLTGLCSG
jgi:hypothetical protein